MAPDIHPFAILIAAIFTSNILLVNFLGMCSFVACGRREDTALGLGIAVTFVLTSTCALNWAINAYMLQPGALVWLLGSGIAGQINLEFLQFITFIAVIAAFVQLVEMIIERFSPTLYYALGIFLPLITVNCAILGSSLFMIFRHYTFMQSVAFGFGSGIGWLMAILLLAGIQQRLQFANVPKPLQGVGVTMIVTGIMAMAFMGFTGMVAVQ